MKLNKKVEIGMNAVVALKKREGFVKTADIASEVGTTINFLEQIMRNLKNGGIIDVKRGPGGGYALKKEKEVTAYIVAKAVGRFPDTVQPSTLADQLHNNIVEAFRQVKL